MNIAVHPKIMAYPKYESYRDSGIDWVGEIPSEWRIKRAGFLLNELSIRSKEGSEPLLSLSKTQGVVRRDNMAERGGQAESLIGYKKVAKGNIVINRMQAANGLLSVSKISGITSPDYAIYETKPDAEILSDIVAMLLRQPEYQGEINRRVKGVMEGFIRLYTDDLFRLPMICAPISEQRAIAAFLDEKCAKIDEAVRIKEEQIKLLRERRQILIQQAVTRGLNPDAPMKDSGIDWVGQIPAHWEVLPLKFIAKLRSGDAISSERFTDAGYPVYGGNGFRGYTNKKTHNGHFVLIGRQGALCGNVNYAKGDFFASEHAIVASPNVPLETVWLGEVIRCANLNRLSQSAAQPGLSVEVIGNQRFPLPPIDEQIEIAAAISSDTSKIDKAVSIKEGQIAALKEYKTSLINAAVTGKIKVI